MNIQDRQVKELFDIVRRKKEAITRAEKPNWQTNCAFSYFRDPGNTSRRLTVSVVNDPVELVDALAFLMRERDSYNQAATQLGVTTKFKWHGYTVEQWAADFATRIDKIQITQKKQELASLDARLEAILSPDLKRALELEAITKLLEEEA